jgi:hypothetical protein
MFFSKSLVLLGVTLGAIPVATLADTVRVVVENSGGTPLYDQQFGRWHRMAPDE